ncbi:hypothetical protein QEH52_18595 [Coraliomargarita sp. SDUM461003]|uniref:Transposase n=1 Tax=Thalassobacterium maritimum TaxID=3041265 RepID=A0ABU1AZP3_9BACT|nr:hypothetical protein [Coraliomargarita sp. SDUM461003]MDQ8209541.1 hypothetical protein [Coraliomargarita sp. SDUM461003]
MNTCVIDYAKIKTEKDLSDWVELHFPLQNPERKKKANADDAGALQIWDYLVENQIKKFEIFESYPTNASATINKRMKVWKSILGFHLYRDNLISVTFTPNPQTKGKKPKS